MVSQTVMWTVDSIMVGRLGKVELAGVGLGGLLVITLYSFFMGLSYSANTYVAQSFGAGRYKACATYMWQGVYLSVAIGAIILIVRGFVPWTIDLLGPKPEVRPFSVDYANIRMLSGPFFILHYYLAHFFRGIGNTRTPMKVAIFANAVNIGLDYLLIFGPGPFPAMGVEGAAWATSTANVLSALSLAAIAISKPYRDRFGTLREWRLRLRAVRELLRLGAPIGFHYILDIGCFLVFAAYVGRMGTDQLAANQIMIQVLALSFMPANGISVAAVTLVGQYLGAGKPDIAWKSGQNAIRIALIYAGIVAAAYMIFPELLVKMFNSDSEVVRIGKRLIVIAAVFQLFDALQIVAAGALRGAGDVKSPMLLALCGSWLVFLPLAYYFGTVRGGGIVGAWTGATIELVLLGMAMFMRFRMGSWQKIRLLSRETDDRPEAVS